MTPPASSGKTGRAYRFGYILLLLVIIAGGGVWAVIRATSMPLPSGADAPGVDANTAPGLPPPETFAEIFAPCAHCHEIGQGAHPMAGPPLTGVIGRKAASYPNYPYSQAMRDSGIVWDDATLARFIANPQEVVPGTRMIFGGLPQEQIVPLVNYIRSVGEDQAKPGTN